VTESWRTYFNSSEDNLYLRLITQVELNDDENSPYVIKIQVLLKQDVSLHFMVACSVVILYLQDNHESVKM